MAVPKENSQPIWLLPPAGEEAGTQCLMVGVVLGCNTQAPYRCAAWYRYPQNRCVGLGGAARPTPALTLLAQKSKQKTATRSLWSNPLYCPFSGRRAQSPAVAATGHITPTWLSHGAPFMPPRKRAQGFDVALYRRGAGRLVGAEVGFAASQTPGWHAPTAEKTKRYHWLCCRAAGKANTKGFFPQRGRKLARSA